MTTFIFRFFTSAVVGLVLIGNMCAAENPGSPEYKETINLHLGKETYIAGETVWYKAYCFSNHKNASRFLSKVLYVELLNSDNQNILSQVLEVTNNEASSYFQIPDTLSTGLYYLTSYTQWMRNTGQDEFYSLPVFIYNQYDEKAARALANYMLPLNPELYIEGGRLLSGMENILIVKIPGLFGRQISVSIAEAAPNRTLLSNKTDSYGIAKFSFNPNPGQRYNLVLGDSVYGEKTIELPLAKHNGFLIKPYYFEGGKLNLKVNSTVHITDPLNLVLLADEKPLAKHSITDDLLGKDISVALPELSSPFLNIQLFDQRGLLLAHQAIILQSKSAFSIDMPKQVYGVNEKVVFKIVSGDPSESGFTNLSAGIYKKSLADSIADASSGISVEGSYAYLPLKNLIAVIARLPFSPASSGRVAFSETKELFPVEDIGILFTGKILSQGNDEPVEGIEVNLALHDTVAAIYASFTDSLGRFAILINNDGNKKASILLKRNEKLLTTSNYRILIDEKFSYSKGDWFESIPITNDDLFILGMKDESQRVIIQRAFRITDQSTDSLQYAGNEAVNSFYGTPLIVVYPEKYLVLPNFEEISREILPRVRFKKTREGCDFFITDVENNIRSERPLILLDGILITNACEVYNLNSDDIERVEIQSGYRVSGNFLYNGLVAIYSSKKYKENHKEKNGNKSYLISGYVNSNNTFVIVPSDGTASAGSTPDFRNQLYWNPSVIVEKEITEQSFYTSDEEGEYVIDVLCYTKNGVPLHFLQTFRVSDQ